MLGHAELLLNDQTYQIPRMAYADFEKLATRWHDADRKAMVDMLDSSGAGSQDRLAELKRLADERIDAYSMVAVRCFRPTFAFQIIAHCVTKMPEKDRPNVADDLRIDRAICKIACDLCGIDHDAILEKTKTESTARDEGDEPPIDELKLRPRLAATG